MQAKTISSILLFFYYTTIFCQKSDSLHLNILFAGDIMGHGPQIKAAYDSSNGTYNYTPCFQYIKPYIQKADIAIANLEVTLGGEPYNGYPVFSSPDQLAVAVKDCGFNYLSTANNHCYDKGPQGFERTIRTLDSLNIKHFGTYIDSASRELQHPFFINKNGITIAIINYTYGTNGIQPQNGHIVNYIQKAQILKDIQKARIKNPDFIIALMHWGNEYELTPNLQQKELAAFLAANGCNAVVGSHPHVVQTFELLYPGAPDSLNVVPVFYSLGNFISNQRNRYRDGGAIFSLQFSKVNNQKIISAYTYMPYWVIRGTLNNLYQYYVIPLAEYSKNKAAWKFPDEDVEKIEQFATDITNQLNNLPVDSATLNK